MKDRWMNVGYEDQELKPYREPQLEIETRRIGKLMADWEWSLQDIHNIWGLLAITYFNLSAFSCSIVTNS